MGLHVVALDVTEEKLALARQLGADIAIDASLPDAAAQVVKLTPIFDVLFKRITLRGAIVGTRKDLAEAIEFAAEGKVRAHIHKAKLEDINQVFADLKTGKVDDRIVVSFD